MYRNRKNCDAYREKMTVTGETLENDEQIIDSLTKREIEEYIGEANLASETLAKLNIRIDTLPQKYQQLLDKLAASQSSLGINQLDHVSISLEQTKDITENLEDDYEILKLKHKDLELQRRIEKNIKFIDELRRELEMSRESLSNQNPGPDNVQDYIRQLKQKVVSYEESCTKAKVKYNKLSIPDTILPKSLSVLVTSHEALLEEARSLRQRAEDITFARDAIQNLHRLRR
ncbi:uncharacterized protein LOC101746454 [Bombyx mori]|uniref:Uncharacterized protein n=1 Tax=Bombyx mori TaxID=7091 RepID=A0A8R1WP77_BOMMO|nr:uncharacterized protein LOC101746454 [Bombyx mori]